MPSFLLNHLQRKNLIVSITFDGEATSNTTKWSQTSLSNVIRIRWGIPSVHIFHLNKFCFISWIMYSHWHVILDELEQTVPQSIHLKLILYYWHKTTTSQIIWFQKFIYQQRYHPSSSTRNLGFIFDIAMSFSEQINSVSKSCNLHIRDIRRIRHLFPLSAATAFDNSLVSVKLAFCIHYNS